MSKFLKKYRALLIIVFLGILVFIPSLVFAQQSTLPSTGCTIFAYDKELWPHGHPATCHNNYDSYITNISCGARFDKNLFYGFKGPGTKICTTERCDDLKNFQYCFYQQKNSTDLVDWNLVSKTLVEGAVDKISLEMKQKKVGTPTIKYIFENDNLGITTKQTAWSNGNSTIEFNLPNNLAVGKYKNFVIYTLGTETQIYNFEFTINPVNCSQYDNDSNRCLLNKYCFFNTKDKISCYNKQDTSICSKLPEDLCGKTKGTGSEACTWSKINNECVKNLAASFEERYPVPKDYYTKGSGILPECAFAGSCKDINDLLELAINVGKWLFSIIGGLAFTFFIYGGFSMIISFGNAEKFKKGQQILVAAVIGMIIAFGAYALVNFLLVSLGVSESLIFVK